MLSLARRLSLLLLVVAGSACASAPQGPEVGAMPQSRNPNRLTREEVVATHTTSTFEAIRMLRPNWLRKRGAMSVTQSSDIMVYVDNVQIGGVQSLHSIPVTSITSVQFLDAATATQRWGTGHVHGAILIITM